VISGSRKTVQFTKNGLLRDSSRQAEAPEAVKSLISALPSINATSRKESAPFSVLYSDASDSSVATASTCVHA
jgi:hypothetical protein